jgi:hypothetical protein
LMSSFQFRNTDADVRKREATRMPKPRAVIVDGPGSDRRYFQVDR